MSQRTRRQNASSGFSLEHIGRTGKDFEIGRYHRQKGEYYVLSLTTLYTCLGSAASSQVRSSGGGQTNFSFRFEPYRTRICWDAFLAAGDGATL